MNMHFIMFLKIFLAIFLPNDLIPHVTVVSNFTVDSVFQNSFSYSVNQMMKIVFYCSQYLKLYS